MADGTEAWTVLRLITWTKEYLARAKVEDPRLCGEMLLAHVLGCPRLGLYTKFDLTPPPAQLQVFRDLIKRAGAGEPVAYLTGQREFYSLSFKVTPDVLIPRPETELLVDVALQAAKKIDGPAKLWDVCTGSGCVAIAAAHYAANLRVLATDISEQALAVAAHNVATHKLAERVTLAQGGLLNLTDEIQPGKTVAPTSAASTGAATVGGASTGAASMGGASMGAVAAASSGHADAPKPCPAQEWQQVHIITANPPYVSDAEMKALPKVVQAEPELALRAGPRGLDVIEKLIAQAPSHLVAGGTLAIEMGAGQASAVFDLLKAGPFEDIRILKDAAGIERTAVAVRTG